MKGDSTGRKTIELTLMRRIISFITCIMVVFTFCIPAYAANNDMLIIKFQIGSTKLTINGKVQNTVKPYVSNNTVFVPMRPILEAYGAEINPKTKGNLNLVYRDIVVNITIGSKVYSANDTKKNLPAAPVIVEKEIMVPAQFITDNFGGKLSSDKSKKNYTLILDDDGAIVDFSTVIGSINKPKIGNSYFGWSMNIPKGSQIVSTSFSSKTVSIENMMNELYIDVDVSLEEEQKLEELAAEIKETKNSYYSDFPGKIQDVYVNTKSSPVCVEILGTVYGKGAAIQRIVFSNGYKYKYSISTTKETNPVKVKEKPLLASILNSFKLGFKGLQKDVYNISKVNENNMVKYTDSVFGFTMEVFPEWDMIKNYSYNIYDSYSVKIGASQNEFISIYPKNAEKIEDMDKYIDNIKAEYDALYNPKYYTFLEKKTVELSNLKLYKIVYMIQLKDQKYVFEDNYTLQGNVLFNISLKSPEDKYTLNKDNYLKVFESIKYTAKLTEEEIKKMLGSSESTKAFSRVSSDDEPTDYESKSNKWKIKIPGYWLTFSGYDESSTVFYNEKNQIYIGIESVKNTATAKSQDDEDKFLTFGSFLEDEESIKIVEKKNLDVKGTTVRQYCYKYDSDAESVYAHVFFNIIEGKDYSYCFFYMVPDIFASEKNINEINDVWNSFTIIQ
ncbi:MAG: copper amine oxidase N-terminal domain-containing protein [Clostridia bacterium]|nr:copper amine oxidase N-terminal domain-containing protein [Clostridia bacterium]